MDEKIEIKNAVITHATIDIGDRGFLTVFLQLDYGGLCQGFGGYVLYLPKSFAHHEDSNRYNFAGHFLTRVMEIAGVGQWTELKGKTIRAKTSWTKVHAIGHIVKDDWFNPSEDFEKHETKGGRHGPEGAGLSTN